MNKNIHTGEFDALIKKIKHKRNFIVALTVILIFTTIIALAPFELVILDETVVLREGINPIFIVLIVLAILLFGAFVYAIVSMPLDSSLNMECDPQKYLTLNEVLNKQKDKAPIYLTAYVYIGNFDLALNYANKLANSKKFALKAAGIFNKARCEYFLGDYVALKATVKQYENLLNSNQNANQRIKEICEKFQKVMNLLVALADVDKEKIADFRNIEVWNNSKATLGFVDYLKGVSAYILNDRNEAIYRLMSVKENLSKTVFAKFAEEYLEKI